MPKSKRIVPRPDAAEPIGIVIAGPARDDVVPQFLAYVWGPAPEPTLLELVVEPRAA